MVNVKSEQKVGVFVDVLNLFFAAKTIHRAKVDYEKLLKTTVEGNICSRAVAYVIRKPDTEQAGFVAALQHIGFEVKVKELRRHTDREGKESADRSSWSVGMAVDALAIAPRLDTAVLVTGNSDFVPLVEALQNAGCKVIVAGIHGSLSQELIKTADGHRVLGEECMFREEGDKVTPTPMAAPHTGSQYGVDDEVDYLSEDEKKALAQEKKAPSLDNNGMGILGSTAADAIDKLGLPK